MISKFSFSSVYTIILLFFGFNSLVAQDTTWVQTFQYGSKTRDSLIQFPNGDHQQYEKILMYYNMRCKGGLISTGTDRNKGCGEWDYSCNTNVIDSSGIDSLKATHPDLVISGINEDFFAYTSTPTFQYIDYNVQNITVNTTSGITKIPAGTHLANENIITKIHKNYKAWFLYRSEEMTNLTNGNISGITLKNKKTGKLTFLKIKLAATNQNELSETLISSLSFTEVVNRNVVFNASGETDVYFHKAFAYNSPSNMVVEISFTGKADDLKDLEILGTKTTGTLSIGNINNDKYLELGAQGVGNVSGDALKSIKNEITVAFWSNGNTEILPINNAIFSADDANKNRQLNVHLPWSNGRIYWDCGGDASGYDRIDKAAIASDYEGKWNHWAFTKNTASGSMKIYLNGQLWHSGTGKTKSINIDKFVLGSDANNTIPYFGWMDDFTVWDKELTIQDIKSLMSQNPLTLSAIQNNLIAYYDMNDTDEFTLTDKSTHHGTCVFADKINQKLFRGNDVFKNFENIKARPDLTWLKGNAGIQINNGLQRDSTLNTPYKVTPYSIIDKKLTAGTPLYYWAAGTFNIYDELGNIIDEILIPEDDVLFIGQLVYHNYFPAKYELLSFVTPYGIGLDLGKEGKTWVFDVTDYGPILKGNKRFLMDKGGEWQEEMNIKFAFIKGKPTRPVLSIQQVWPATAYGYQSILANDHLEKRQLHAGVDVKSMKIRTVATGHGQEGEFIPRTHSIDVNGDGADFSWQLWKECGDNPISPQGGTWVYDRAGWCPGAPSDLKEFEIMPLVTSGNNFSLDYGLNTATGDSRYIVNTQLVKYGDITFANDAAVLDIIAPSSDVNYHRLNPSCANPTIMIVNNGSKNLTSAQISYGIEGGISNTYTWTGNLGFLKSQKIILPNLPIDAFYAGKKFFASIQQINNVNDEYSANNKLTTNINPVKNLDGGIIVSMKTNGMPNETKWTLKDSDGKIIRSSKTGLAAFTIYNDTIPNLSGCYQLQFTDSDQDGISWWANGDGDGYIRAKGVNGSWMVFQPDFGSEYTFNFVSGIANATTDAAINQSIRIYPNPTTGETRIDLSGFIGITKIELLSQTNTLLHAEQVTNQSAEVLTTYVDLSEMPSGIYFVKITNKSVSKMHKLIKI